MSDDIKTADGAPAAEPTIRIINRAHDGFRRGGLAHPADATYPASRFTSDQIESIEADPALTVIKGDGAPELLAASAKRRGKK